MTLLKLTPTRLALMCAIADGQVTDHHPLGGQPYAELDHGPGFRDGGHPRRYARVTAGVRRLRRDSIVVDNKGSRPGRAPQLCVLTDQAAAWLKEATS